MYGRGRGRGKKAQQPVLVPVPVLVEDVWVQCDNPDCKKWRKLPPGSKAPPDDIEWFCSMNADPLKNSCSAPEEDYEDKDWEAREAQVKAQVAALQQQGQLPLDKSAGLPVLQAPLMMYQSGLAGYGKRPGGGEARQRKRGKPEGLPAKYFPTHQDELAALEVAFQHIMDNGGLYDDAVATKEAATAVAATSAAAAAAAAAAEQQAQSSAAAPPHTKLALPLWLWNGLQVYAPDAAEVACQAVDLVTASLSVCGPCLEQRQHDEQHQQQHRQQQQQQQQQQYGGNAAGAAASAGPGLQRQPTAGPDPGSGLGRIAGAQQGVAAAAAEHEVLYQQRVRFAQLAVLAAVAGAMHQLQLVKRRHGGAPPAPPPPPPPQQQQHGGRGGRGRGRGRGRSRVGRPPLHGRGSSGSGGSGGGSSASPAAVAQVANGMLLAHRGGHVSSPW